MDLNPIEKLWSKIKALLLKFKARTVEALPHAIIVHFKQVLKQIMWGGFALVDICFNFENCHRYAKNAAFSSRALSSILLSFQSNSHFCHPFSLKRRFYDFQPRYVDSSVRVFSQISSAITLQFFAFIPAAFPTASSSFIPGFLPFPSTVVLCSPK